MLVLALLHHTCSGTCKLGQREHKLKRKERKLKNSDKLSAYIPVCHVGIKSCAKRQSGRAIVPHFYVSALAYVTLAYAYAYHRCKHPCACACAYAYACVTRINHSLPVGLFIAVQELPLV